MFFWPPPARLLLLLLALRATTASDSTYARDRAHHRRDKDQQPHAPAEQLPSGRQYHWQRLRVHLGDSEESYWSPLDHGFCNTFARRRSQCRARQRGRAVRYPKPSHERRQHCANSLVCAPVSNPRIRSLAFRADEPRPCESGGIKPPTNPPTRDRRPEFGNTSESTAVGDRVGL